MASSGRPRPGRRPPAWPDHEWTRVDGRLLHAAAAGAPGLPTVVLVHGLGMSHRYAAPLARRLSAVARVVGLDLPGSGLSEPRGWGGGGRDDPDVAGLSRALLGWLRATGREGAVVVGHSVGTQVVAHAAVRAPAALGRLVLVGTTVDARARSWTVQAARLGRDLVLERPDLLPVLAGDYLRCGPPRYVRTFASMLADPVEGAVARLPRPAVLVRGAWDPVSPRAWNEALLARLPEGRLVEVPHGPHNLVWTRSAPLAEVVREVVHASASDRAHGARSG